MTILLLTQWRGRTKGGYLLAASALSVVWAGVNAWHIVDPVPLRLLLSASEAFRTASWLFFLMAVLEPLAERSATYRRALLGGRILLLVLFAVVLLIPERVDPLDGLIAPASSGSDL